MKKELILTILILTTLLISGCSFDNTGYASCVDNCVYDNYDCLSTSWFNRMNDNEGNAYIKWLDVENCQTDLESCVDSC